MFFFLRLRLLLFSASRLPSYPLLVLIVLCLFFYLLSFLFPLSSAIVVQCGFVRKQQMRDRDSDFKENQQENDSAASQRTPESTFLTGKLTTARTKLTTGDCCATRTVEQQQKWKNEFRTRSDRTNTGPFAPVCFGKVCLSQQHDCALV